VEAEGICVFAHGGDAEGDVFFDGDAEFYGAVAESSRLTPLAKALSLISFLLIPFPDPECFLTADVAAGGDEAG